MSIARLSVSFQPRRATSRIVEQRQAAQIVHADRASGHDLEHVREDLDADLAALAQR